MCRRCMYVVAIKLHMLLYLVSSPPRWPEGHHRCPCSGVHRHSPRSRTSHGHFRQSYSLASPKFFLTTHWGRWRPLPRRGRGGSLPSQGRLGLHRRGCPAKHSHCNCWLGWVVSRLHERSKGDTDQYASLFVKLDCKKCFHWIEKIVYRIAYLRMRMRGKCSRGRWVSMMFLSFCRSLKLLGWIATEFDDHEVGLPWE